MERFISILIEHTAGKFPLWLLPEQFAILPISDKFLDYSKQVQDQLAAHDIRGTIDNRGEKIGKKIRDTWAKKIPFMIIVGEEEVNSQTLTIRTEGENKIEEKMTLSEFVEFFKAQL
jgi:threonyl-tRNA synthetase